MKKFLIILFIIIIFLLCSCTKETSISTNLTYQQYEGIVQEYGTYSIYEYTKYEGVTYYFQAEEYDKSQRSTIIANVDKVLQILKLTNEQNIPKEFSIYFGSALKTQGIYGNVFYTTAYEDTIENIIPLLQGIYREYANYGILYGYANFLLKELGIETKSICTKEEIANYLIQQDDKMVSGILDLNLPFFEQIYADKKINDISKSIAVLFVEDMIQTYGMEEIHTMLTSSYSLDTSFDNMFCNRINEWLETELKMEYDSKNEAGEITPTACIHEQVTNTECDCLFYRMKKPYTYAIRFEKNYAFDCENYPYILHTVSTKSYIHKDMQTLWYESETMQSEKFDYLKIMQYFQFLETNIEIAKQYLSQWLDIEDNRVTMQFFMPNAYENIAKSQYHFGRHTASVVLLQLGYHEYIHHLTSKYYPESWLVEGLAVYMDIYYPENKSSSVSECTWWVHHADQYERFPDKIEENNFEYTKALQTYVILTQSKLLQNEFSKINSKYDLEAYFERAVYMECLGYDGWGTMGKNAEMNMTYEKAGSLFHYMIETYGEEYVFEIYKELGKVENELKISYMELLEEKLGISYTKLLENWEKDLRERCETK